MIRLFQTFRVILNIFFGRSAAKENPAPLTKHQLWMVSLSAIYGAQDEGSFASYYTLYPFQKYSKTLAKAQLEDGWSIKSRNDLYQSLNWLATEGHSAELARTIGHRPWAWDICRYVALVRNGFAAEFINEEEAWQALAQIAPIAATNYSSWKDYSRDFVLGRQKWLGQIDPEDESRVKDQETTMQAIDWLLHGIDNNSPWQQLEWKVINEPDGPFGGDGNVIKIRTRVQDDRQKIEDQTKANSNR
jgi:hypothetical protein